MGRKLRRWGALLAALVLVWQLMAPLSLAAPTDAYFTGVNDNLLELHSDTMPFWSGGELYVPHTVFVGTDLSVYYSRSFDKQTVMLYTLRRTLSFDMQTGECYDHENRAYSARLITRGDCVFFPLDTVAAFFGLTWTYNRTQWVPLIRIKSSSVILSDEIFLDAGKDMMRSRYAAYEKTLTQEQDVPPAVETGRGQRVYLLLEADDENSTALTLDILGQHDKQVTFYMTAAQMETRQDLLRRLVAQGHGIAVDLSGTDEASAPEELAAANRILWDATCAATRLVYLGQAQELREPVEALGFVPCRVDIDNSDRPLNGTRRVESLYGRMAEQEGDDLCVCLGSASENESGLAVLVSRLHNGGRRVIAYRENLR